MRWLWLAIPLAACTGSAKDHVNPDTGDTTGTETTGSTDDSGTGTGTDTEVDQSASLSGHVLDTSGNPISGAHINVCRAVCRTATSGADGTYTFAALEPLVFAVDVPAIVGSGDATPLFSTVFGEGQHKDLDVTIPKLGAQIPDPATPKDVEITTGMWINIGQSTVSVPFGVDATELAGVQVDPANWPDLSNLAATPVAVWYLDPYDSTVADGGAPITKITNSWGLAPGDTYEIWAANYGFYRWDDGGSLTVSSDGLTLTGTAKIPQLTTIVLARE